MSCVVPGCQTVPNGELIWNLKNLEFQGVNKVVSRHWKSHTDDELVSHKWILGENKRIIWSWMSESDEDVILSSQKLFSTLFEENSGVLVPQVPDSEVEALSYLARAFAWQILRQAKCQNCQKDVIHVSLLVIFVIIILLENLKKLSFSFCVTKHSNKFSGFQNYNQCPHRSFLCYKKR